jgi:hypothetical protein
VQFTIGIAFLITGVEADAMGRVWGRQGAGVTGGSPLGFDVGAKGAGGTLEGLDLVPFSSSQPLHS